MNYEYPPVSILGSTGSVGEQAIDVAVKNGIRVNCLSANRNVLRVEEQARALGVRACAMADAAFAAFSISLISRFSEYAYPVFSPFRTLMPTP